MALHIRVECSAVYEFIGSFMLFVQRKWIHNVDDGLEWVRYVEQQVPDSFLIRSTQLQNYSINEFDMLFAASLELNHSHQVSLFLEQLEAMNYDAWLSLFAHSGLPYDNEHVDRLKQGYIPLLHEWYEHYFRWSVPNWEPILIEDAAEKTRLLNKMSPVDLIELATNGAVFDNNDHMREVILAPMWHYRPIINTCTFTNTTLVLYATESEEDDDVPPKSLKRMIHALSSDVRLKMLRYLSHESVTFSELVSFVQLEESSVQQHLVILRAAGYIRTFWNGKVERISLRQEGISDLSAFLENYVQS
ncbi:winged helix-turn-helix domain-containing protein [Paenibacillus sp. SC116]|uniref:ArsR/SmtB family transcription factor n=1 Tax=Paenibacillus sp. SC116 TaxID=2968986 RepID=UPI00215A9989|nr:winged helix-turn-helix domain-containing protein [Paenibacillus sp. SC116]MCR8842774.1 winged helix-turn-helix domain-containing protein [Paenibacillus sp. SC116]